MDLKLVGGSGQNANDVPKQRSPSFGEKEVQCVQKEQKPSYFDMLPMALLPKLAVLGGLVTRDVDKLKQSNKKLRSGFEADEFKNNTSPKTLTWCEGDWKSNLMAVDNPLKIEIPGGVELNDLLVGIMNVSGLGERIIELELKFAVCSINWDIVKSVLIRTPWLQRLKMVSIDGNFELIGLKRLKTLDVGKIWANAKTKIKDLPCFEVFRASEVYGPLVLEKLPLKKVETGRVTRRTKMVVSHLKYLEGLEVDGVMGQLIVQDEMERLSWIDVGDVDDPKALVDLRGAKYLKVLKAKQVRGKFEFPVQEPGKKFVWKIID